MERYRVLLSPAILAALLLGACRDTDNGRTAAPTLQPSVLVLSVQDCAALNDEYILALQEARVCNPLLHPNQCTLIVSSELECPCPVSVNPRNREAREKMRTARNAWAAGECSTRAQPCLANLCRAPIAECIAVSSANPPEPSGGACKQ
jgi:hypothetical protein